MKIKLSELRRMLREATESRGIYDMLFSIINSNADSLSRRPFEATVNELAYLVDEQGEEIDPDAYYTYNESSVDEQIGYLEVAVTNFMNHNKSSIREVKRTL